MGIVGDKEVGLTQRDPNAGRVVLNGASILTAEGGRFALSPELRDMMCLTSDGDLYISSANGMNHHVLAFIERLNRNGIAFRRIEIPLGQIRQLYQEASQQRSHAHAGNPSGDDTTHRQREVIALIKECVGMGVSDIHFRINGDIAEIWIRVHGELQRLLTRDGVPRDYTRQHGHELCATMYQSMCDVAEEFHKPEQSQDGRLKKEYLKACGLFGARIATRPTERGYLMVLRLLYGHRGKKPTLADLGYLPEQIALIRRMTLRTVGINIFSGPTGSGKSTTLECLLSMLLAEFENKIHLLTLEDPPEYEVAGAVQTPIICDRRDPAALSREWANAISNSMRLDPDVMMVGEIRDLDSAVAAFRAAMTGHGLWTTLHANDVTSVLGRLQDIGVHMSLLTDAALVTGLINQSLAPVLCPQCKVPFAKLRERLPADLVERVQLTCEPDKVFLSGAGCDHPSCRQGIVGRTVIAEVIMPTQQFMTTFQNQGKAAARAYWTKSMGGITKNQHLIRRINEGVMDPRLAERRVCPLDYDLITLA